MKYTLTISPADFRPESDLEKEARMEREAKDDVEALIRLMPPTVREYWFGTTDAEAVIGRMGE